MNGYGHTGVVVDVAFSPDGKTLASASEDKTLKLWWVDRSGLVDTISPVRSKGRLIYGVSQVVLFLTTNKNAECRYSELAETDFDAMTNTFSTTTAQLHRIPVTEPQSGESQVFYVRCRDKLGNTNKNDFVINAS